VLNRRIALDAGAIGFWGTPEEQLVIDHLLLTHAHLDHIASLPIFLENVYDLRDRPPVVYASRAVLDVLQRDVFNEQVWPDFVALSQRTRPFVSLVHFEAGETIEVEGMQITAVAVNHTVPTNGFLLRDESGTVAFVPDTAPTEEIWVRASACSDLLAVVVETTFPDELDWLACESKHLTPSLLRGELAKLARPVPTYIMHLKARYRVEVCAQLAALGLPQLRILQPGVGVAV
jgi:ribonuclease BN (tRNA processing enzyme)